MRRSKGGHVYNLVYYQGKFRIMDYFDIGTYFDYSSCWNQHSTDNILNDHYGDLDDDDDKRPFAGRLLMNFPGTSTCPTAMWNSSNYYQNVCP